jgi:hypothetical protein
MTADAIWQRFPERMRTKCGEKQLIEQSSTNCGQKTSSNLPFLEPPVGFEPTTFALQDQKEARFGAADFT